MLEGHHVAQALVVVKLRDWTALPGSTEIEAGAMLATTRAVARISGGAFQPVSVSENVQPRGDPDALA